MTQHYGSNHWASNHWQSNHFAGAHAVAPPAGGGSGGKRRLERPGMSFDAGQLNEKALQAENNARAALLVAILEAEDL